MSDREGQRIARHLAITGRVQGVGFRWWVQNAAAGLGVAGWVRNRRDGSVEAVFAGPANAVARMIEACQSGPSAARVADIAVREATAAEVADLQDGGIEARPTV